MNQAIIIRVVIYTLISMGVAFKTGADDVDLSVMDWWQWLKFTVGIGLAGLVTVRAFLDQTVTRINGLPENQEKV
jgi:hypothetical protein